MKIFFFITLSLLIISSGCKKEKKPSEILPEATLEGKNTVGFVLDDNSVWVPNYQCGFGRNPCGKISARVYGPVGGESIEFMFIRNNRESSSSLSITSIGLGTITSPGDKLDSIFVRYRSETSTGLDGSYAYPLPGSNFIITKFDSVNQIISGKFDFILNEQNLSGKKITIKNGRFDFHFNACVCDE